MQKWPKRIFRSIKGKYRQFWKADVPVRAAALGFHTLLAIVPCVGLVFWYLSRINVLDQWRDLVKGFVLDQLNTSSSEVFSHYFEILTGTVSGGSWGWIGLGVFIYTAWNMIARFGDSLDIILGSVPEHPSVKLSYLQLIGRRILIMLGLPIAMTISLGVSQWIRQDSWFHYLVSWKAVGPIIALPVAWLTGVVATFFVYYFVPRIHVRWTEALKAAAIVVPLTEVVSYGFGVYNAHAVSVYKVYGVLAVIPIFILWIQLFWMILLAGALLIEFPVARKGKSSRRPV